MGMTKEVEIEKISEIRGMEIVSDFLLICIEVWRMNQ
jgi:hypothetical protein